MSKKEEKKDKKDKKDCSKETKKAFVKGIRAGIYIAKKGLVKGKFKEPKKPKKDKKEKKPKKDKKDKKDKKPKKDKKDKKDKKPKKDKKDKKYTREELQKLPPQGRKGVNNLSTIARGLKIKITKPNGTRKRKATLINEILKKQQ